MAECARPISGALSVSYYSVWGSHGFSSSVVFAQWLTETSQPQRKFPLINIFGDESVTALINNS